MSTAGAIDTSADTIHRQGLSGRERTRANTLPASPTPQGHEPREFADILAGYGERKRPSRIGPPPMELVTSGTEIAGRPTVRGLLCGFRDGTTTPSAVLDGYLERWKTSPSTSTAVLGAIAGATAAARESDERWAGGTARSLEGIPFGVKDIIDVAGATVTCGSLQTGDRIAENDATVVARLREAGAIPVAMLATTEFAMGAAANARYGVVPNPWNPTRWTGGSSTGSGAGLAAGLFPFALGTDTGGSIRIPSAFCGITGLKPTYGLLPRTGVATLSWSLDHVGPMGLTASDLRLVLAAMDTPSDLVNSGVPVDAAHAQALPLDGIVLGTMGGWHLDPIDEEVLAAFNGALDTLGDLGAGVKDFLAPGYDPELAHVESWNVFYGEVAATQEGNLATAELFDPGTRSRIEEGRDLPAIDYLRGLRRRGSVLTSLLEAMDALEVDFLLLPTVLAGAPFIEDMSMSVNGVRMNIHDILPRNTRIFDYTGLPALAIPMGHSSTGLPLSLQIVGRPHSDYDILAVGEAFQAATAFHLRTPPNHAH